MARRIWIIPKKDKIVGWDYEDAKLANCPEIVNGIPPRLEGIIREQDLPMAFEEPEYPPPPKPRDLAAEIDEIKAKIADYDTLKAKVEALGKK